MSLLQSRPRAIADAATPEEVVIAWGDRVVPEAPTFSARRHTATAATGQVGLDVERVGTLPLSAVEGAGGDQPRARTRGAHAP